jgi:hypothetical protein
VTTADEFRRRAAFEAGRYGGGEWVFLRELLQNARDAGASRVDLTVERRDGVDRVVCADDGCGMSFDHARRYLFTLYASSKTGRRDMAGRFGIGFWSVLRFQPDELVVRSAPAAGEGWMLRLDGELSRAERGGCDRPRGTEVELVRRSRGDDPVAAARHAVERDARHLRRLRPGDEILEVRLNGLAATAEIALDPPSLELARPGRRAAAALADRARVDLLAHGLRIRTTATLDELLTGPGDRRRRFAGASQGLLPRVVLDGRRLRVLMARGDARTDRELRRLVGLGHRAVRRLVRGQLDREAGLGPLGRAAARLREVTHTRRARWWAAAAAGVVVVGIGLWRWGAAAPGTVPRSEPSGGPPAGAPSAPIAVLREAAAGSYLGPAVDVLARDPVAPPLSYRPAEARPMLALLRLTAIDDGGRVVPPPATGPPHPYVGARCAEACLEIALELGGEKGPLRLPVPTGHLLDPASLRMSGGAATLRAADDGGPVLDLDGVVRGRLEYRTGPVVETGPRVVGRWPELPPSAVRFAERLVGLEPGSAATAARDWVARRVVYDTSDEVVRRHREAAVGGDGFVARCLAVGAGDCDVQSAVLAAILHRAGFEVRLAVGFVGVGGRALPGLHAWVEVRTGDGWREVDPSGGGRSIPDDAGSGTGPGDEAARTDPRIAAASGSRLVSTPVVPLLAALALAATTVVALRARTRLRGAAWGESADLAGLLRGALTRPEAFAEAPALFSRRVVPVLGGAALSLERANRLARRGRLVAGSGSGLARAAAAAGRAVVDTRRPEGRAVAAVLGAVDLDRWDAIRGRGATHPVCADLVRAAAGVGECWEVRLGPGRGDEIEVLDGRAAGLGRCRIVAVDGGGRLWRGVASLAERSPAAAALLLGESVSERLRWPAARSRRLVSRLAAAALAERREHLR